jgi:hypothetical protein
MLALLVIRSRAVPRPLPQESIDTWSRREIMFEPRKRLMVVLVAAAVAVGAGFTASKITGVTTNEAHADRAISEVQQPVPEALLPPVAPVSAGYRM